MEHLTSFNPEALAEWASTKIFATRQMESYFSEKGDSINTWIEIGRRKAYEEVHRQALEMMLNANRQAED